MVFVLASGVMSSAPAQASSTENANNDSSQVTVDLDHPIAFDSALTIAQDSATDHQATVESFEFMIGNGIGHYIYDSDLSLSANESLALENLADQAPGGTPAITEITFEIPEQDSSPHARSTTPDKDLTESVAEDAEQEKEQDAGDVDLAKVRDAQIGTQEAAEAEAQAAADPNKPSTRGHPNVTWFQTKDNVKGKRQLIVMESWLNSSNAKKAPFWWGSETQLYQHNKKLSSKKVRPFCPADTDDRFWADARLKGASMTMVVNDGTGDSSLKKMETYIDKEHSSDECSKGAIGFGIGKPAAMPDMKFKNGKTTTHQTVYVDMRLKPGKNSWSHVSAATKYVQNNCNPQPAGTKCMGLGLNPARNWPASLGGPKSTDMLLLNANRNWRTPTHFSWDEYADKRPKALK